MHTQATSSPGPKKREGQSESFSDFPVGSRVGLGTADLHPGSLLADKDFSLRRAFQGEGTWPEIVQIPKSGTEFGWSGGLVLRSGRRVWNRKNPEHHKWGGRGELPGMCFYTEYWIAVPPPLPSRMSRKRPGAHVSVHLTPDLETAKHVIRGVLKRFGDGRGGWFPRSRRHGRRY